MSKYIMALDAGTTSNRAIIFNKKQKSVAENYFFEDLSLTEIAKLNGISKQAVSSMLKRTENKLLTFEKKLCIIEKNERKKDILKDILKSIEDEDFSNAKKSLKNLIEKY